MTWYVYCENEIGEIALWNIFKNKSFQAEVEQLLGDVISKSDFDERLNRIVKYYFKSKCEYEVCLATWPRGEVVKKISVYDQIYMNWPKFCRCIWEGYDD